MSFEEKGTWLYLVIVIALPVVYFATILGQLSSVPVAEIDYQGPLLVAIGAAIGLAIVGMIVIAIIVARRGRQVRPAGQGHQPAGRVRRRHRRSPSG